ncbi:MAG: hypothetical protein WBC04_05430 [Candidatus Acidiferrales bacterium]
MNQNEALRPQFDRALRAALIVGILGLSTTFLGSARNPTQFFRSYLFAYLFWIGVPLGCMAILMLHHLTGGRWGVPIRRVAEAGSRTFLLMAVLFVPIWLGLSRLFLWAQPEAVAADPILQYKRPYLNPSFFTIRAAIYFAIWVSLAYLLSKWSQEQDDTGNPQLAARFEGLSAPGLILYGLTVTFASVDWVMSLEPHWFSTIYGMLFMVIEALTAMAFMILVARLLAESEPVASAASPAQWNDLGNLLFAFVMLWAYLSFSQFLIIWATNLKDEIPWYVSRASGGWGAIAIVLVILHFTIPFLLLLSRDVKRRKGVLATLAGALIVISFVDLYWLVVPAFEPGGPRIHPMDLTAPLGIGGLWVAAFLWQLKKRPLVPLHAADMEEAVEHGD